MEKRLNALQGRGIGADIEKNFEVVSCTRALDLFGIKNPVVFDIGANVGLWSHTFLEHRPSARIYAFEPSAVAREVLVERFKCDNRVTIVPIALGKKSGKANLFSDSPGSGLGSLKKRRLDHFGIEMKEIEEVNVMTLDEWAKRDKIYPHLIKVDVEGFELDVFEGASQTLQKCLAVQFEFGGCNIDTRTYFQDFFYFFTMRNFSLHRIAANKTIAISRYREEDEYFKTTNYIAIKNKTE